MKYTIAHLAIKASPQETVRVAGLAGFRNVGIRMCGRYVGDDSFVNVINNGPVIAEIKAELAAQDVSLSNVSAFQFYPGLTMSHLESVVDTTAELGASTIVVNSFMEDSAHFADLFARYAECAAGRGIALALEFLPYSQVKSMEDALSITRGSGMSNVGILVDMLHLDRSGGSLASLSQVPRDDIVFAQICDAGRGKSNPSGEDLMTEARTARMPLGAGDLPLFDFMDALPEDIELEYEVANAADRDLSPIDRARNSKRDLDAFLLAYQARNAEREAAS